jgi:hypothetical protein
MFLSLQDWRIREAKSQHEADSSKTCFAWWMKMELIRVCYLDTSVHIQLTTCHYVQQDTGLHQNSWEPTSKLSKKLFFLFPQSCFCLCFTKKTVDTINNNSVALVRERTIPTERLPLVGEVSANDRGVPYSPLSSPEPLIFLPSSSSVVLTRLSGPRSRSTTSQKIW